MHELQRFRLVFRTIADEKIEKEFCEGFKKFVEDVTCENCPAIIICPSKEVKTCPAKMTKFTFDFGRGKIMTNADHTAIVQMAHVINTNPAVTFIFLVDDKEDIGYLYKAEGSLEHVRKEILPGALKGYEKANRFPVFFSKLRDMRHTMTVNPTMN